MQIIVGAVIALFAFVAALTRVLEYIERRIIDHARFREAVARWLAAPSYDDAYRDWLGRRLKGLQTWMGGLWSPTALMRCLAIAFAYPAALLFISYGFGGPGTVGTTEFLPTLAGWRQPALGFGLLTVMIGLGLAVAFSERIDRHMLGVLERRLERRGSVNSERQAKWLYQIGGAGAAASLMLAATLLAGIPVAGTAAGAVTLALALALNLVFAVVAFAVVGTGAGTAVLAVALAGALAVAGAVAGAGAAALAATGAVVVGLAVALALPVAVVVAVAGAGAGAYLWLTGGATFSVAFFLFCVILPAANALLDWQSWAISRWLGQDLYDLMRDRPRGFGSILHWLFRGAWKPASFFVHVAADLLGAVGLLVLLAALLPFLIQAINIGVVASGGDAPLELRDYLQAAAEHPWPDGAWAIAMLLTTLIPTALHAGAAIMMLLLLPLQLFAWRERLAAGLAARKASDRAWAATRASWLVTITPVVASALVVGIGLGLVWLIGALWEPIATILLAAAEFGIASADRLATLVGR